MTGHVIRRARDAATSLLSFLRIGDKEPERTTNRIPYFQVARQEIPNDDFDAAFDAAFEAESRTCKLMPTAPTESPDRKKDSMMAQKQSVLLGERMLAERRVGTALEHAYTAATKAGTASDRQLVRIALLHWTVLFRRRFPESAHTVVPGLVDDKVCAGDLIADQLLWKYFTTLFADPGRADEPDGTPVAAARTLAAIARQTVCLSTRQSAAIASDLYWSYKELQSWLDANGLSRIFPALAQAAAAPLFLLYDVEKYRGTSYPLGRWFTENCLWLISGAESGRAPQTWQRLWLYDRRSGHMFGYRTGLDTDENGVDLVAFFGSIVRPSSIGRGECTFGEMVERGLRDSRYACLGAVCAELADPTSPTSRRTHRDLMDFGTTRDVSKLPVGTAANCGESGGGGGDGCQGGGGVSLPGRNWAAQVVACLSEQVVSPYEESFRCLSELTGRCSDPVGQATKIVSEALHAGVRFGSRCALVQTGPDGGFNLDRWRENFNKMLDEVGADPEKFVREKARRDLEKAQEQTEKITDEALQKMKELEEKEKAGTQEEIDKAKQEFDEKMKELDKAIQDEKKAKEKNDKLQGTSTQLVQCPPDTPDCGGNNCTAMGTAIAATMACNQSALTGDESNEFVPQPGVIDPSPLDDPSAPSWNDCLKEPNSEQMMLRRQCWAFDCPPGQTAVGVSDQICGCGPSFAEGSPSATLEGNCGAIMCPEGTVAIPGPTGCLCQSAFGDDGCAWGGGPQPPAAGFQVPLPIPNRFPGTVSTVPH